jgi:muramoyltetrapeptide carboxypeptidase
VTKPFTIGVVAPGGFLRREPAEAVAALCDRLHPDGSVRVVFHPQCFQRDGHFAGDDATRLAALVEVANDPDLDAVWFAKGGYGANRIAEAAVSQLDERARAKPWLGYSDGGFLLAALYRAGFGRLAHGPMALDFAREGGEAAIARALAWLAREDRSALEPTVGSEGPTAAFNLVVLGRLVGTPLEPDLTGHVLMLEEVGEHHYRLDRDLFHLTSQPSIRRVKGIRLGRCSAIPGNDPSFGADEEAICRHWCERSGVRFLGRADIGHDAENKVVPFGPPA